MDMTSLMHLTAACFFSLYWLTLCICDGARVDDDVTGDGGRTRAAGIVNGHDSPDRPFYVRVRPHQPGRKGTCGGCVISRHLVLTAAHCVGREGSQMEVQVGSFNRGNLHYTSIYGHGFLHPRYGGGRGGSRYDIAFIDISVQLEKRRVIPVCEEQPRRMVVCGMGRTSPHGLSASWLKELQLVQQPCIQHGVDERTNFCGLGLNEDSDSCAGDSGGPLFGVERDGQVTCVYGIVSAGDRLCLRGGIYTKAELVWDFIDKSAVEREE